MDNKIDHRGWGTRHTFAVMAFAGFANVFAMRVNLSVAIVAMVKHSNGTEDNLNVTEIECSANLPNSSADEIEGEYDWNSADQGLALGAFFFGNILTQVPGGIAAEKYGGKWVFSGGILFSAIATLLTPLAANFGLPYFIVLRALQGFGQGVTFPAMFPMISTWIPPQERSRLASVIWSGSNFGTFVTLPISALLSDQFGWSSSFYFFGTLGILWSFCFIFLCFDSPSRHPRISQEERDYIESSFPHKPKSEDTKLPNPPFRKIITSIPVYALMFTHIGNNWGMYTLLTEIPTYLNDIQHISLKSNGLLSGLPYFLMWLFALICGVVADKMVKTSAFGLDTGMIRKLFNTIGHIGPALGLLGLAYTGCSQTYSIFWLCMSVMFNGAIYSGFAVNHVELTPNYAGTVMGITNAVANIGAFSAPYLTGLLIRNNQTLEAWRSVYLIAAGVYFADSVIFTFFGSSEVQPWNTYWEEDLKVI